jgi:DDE superfamily endonuclease
LLGLLRECFVRVEPWLQAGKYVAAVASGMAKRNGWTIAEQVGDRTPQRTQRLLNRAMWDAFAAMGVVRRFAVAGLDEAARRGRRRGLAVGVLDETSQVKQGVATAGVKRHYLGCVGKVANGITTHPARPRHPNSPGQIAIGDCRTSRFSGWPANHSKFLCHRSLLTRSSPASMYA